MEINKGINQNELHFFVILYLRKYITEILGVKSVFGKFKYLSKMFLLYIL